MTTADALNEPMTMAKALNFGLRRAMEGDSKVVVMGEDVGPLGGVFRVTDALQKDFGEDRVIDTPLAESAIIGSAVGLALRGYRPVCEIQFDGFVFPGFDQIVSQVAKIRNRSAGTVTMPITIRIPYGGGIGAIEHHSESPETYFAHTPGLRVVSCSNPSEAYWMIQEAIASDDPVVFFEPKRLYHAAKGVIEPSPTPLDSARIVRSGRDLTLVSYGSTVSTALATAEAAAQEGIEIEVVDLRSISPLDMPTLIESVGRTGRMLITHEAQQSFGVGAEIAARVTEQAFYSLEAPVLRVTGYDTPYPPSRLEHEWLPNLDRLLDAVDKIMEF
jgi:2-oxoisovalerate dehydrogenase E1 component beta subunit